MSFKDQFPDWEDFPSGLRVLVVENGEKAAASVGQLLEECDFHATTSSSGAQALSALQAGQNKFHVALVEATMAQEGADAFDLKKASGQLPVILMSGAENMLLMTQSVTMGAVDFVQKPLTADKIKDRNIWMHVVRKAHQDGVKLVKPGREGSSPPPKAAPLIKVKEEPHGAEDVATSSGDNHSASRAPASGEPHEGALEGTSSCDRCAGTPAAQKVKAEHEASPISSSPQNSDITNVAAVKSEAEDADTQRSPGGNGEFSFRERGDGFDGFGIYDQNGLIDVKLELDGADCLGGAVVDADGHVDGDLCLADSFLPLDTLELNLDPMGGGEIHNRELEDEDARMLAEMACIAEDSPDSCAGPGPYSEHSGDGSLMRHDSLISFDGSGQSDGETGHESDGTGGKSERCSKRSKKMDWSPEMHRRFVDAVEKIGVDKAIPSKILDHMGVTNLTRHNVASHLQKYRTHRKHMLQSKEGEATNWARRPAESAQWTRARRDGTAWLGVSSHQPPIQPRPAQIALPPLHSGPPMGPPLHVWGHPTVDHSGGHMWHAPHMGMPSPPWMGADGMSWQHGETWGHPTAPHLAGGWPHGPPLMMKGGMHPAPGSPWVHPPPLMIKMGPGQGGGSEDGLALPMYPLHPMQHSNVAAAATAAAMQGPPELNPPKEILDAAISEALANPYSSLPLGLNPPSMEGVLAELQKNGDGMDIHW